MKKTLLAMAVLAASGASFAQSSVTLYGVADLGIAKTTGQSAEMVGNSTANNGSGRFGLRGTEDLGGGLKAGFNYEAGINAEDGSIGTKMFARAANITLSGGFGEIRLGRSLSLGFNAVAAYELTGTANYSIIGNTFGFNNGTRNDSEIRYTSPEMGGFQAGIGYIMKPDNGGAAKLDLGATYKNGPIAAGVAYTKTQGAEKAWLLGGYMTSAWLKLLLVTMIHKATAKVSALAFQHHSVQ